MNNEEKVTGNDGLEIFATDEDAGQVTATVEIPPQGGPSAESAAKNTSRSRSKKATGPRTERGKQIASRNALKHGIFAAAVLPQLESHGGYKALVRRLQDYFQPEGSMEQLLVEKLATIFWRHHRLLAAEGAEIQKAVEYRTDEKLRLEALEIESRVELNQTTSGMWHYCLITRNPFLVDRMIRLLKDFRNRLDERGFIRRFDIVLIRKLFGPVRAEEEPTSFQMQILELEKSLESAPRHTAVLPDENSRKVHGTSGEDAKESIDGLKDTIAHRIDLLELLQSVREQLDGPKQRFTETASLVPPPDVVERLIRYEAHLSREFDRTLSQLERLQRMRLGQPVLPPVKVEVSH